MKEEDLSDSEIARRIGELSEELSRLKLAIEKRSRRESDRQQPTEGRGRLKVGDAVEILNPRVGQISAGKIVKANEKTDRYTVEGGRFSRKVIRASKNLKKVGDLQS